MMPPPCLRRQRGMSMSNYDRQHIEDVTRMNTFSEREREERRIAAADVVQREILVQLKRIIALLESAP